ncbi:MAG: response regulator [Oligoflexia bacterium]|nr:response regulator [Oligoflexia bacterium]
MALKASMKILLADAVPGNRQILRKMLSDIGFKNVIEAGDGEQAFAKIEESFNDKPVEFIISEYNLDKLNGLDLLKKVKATESTKKIPFLMITGEADQQVIVLAVKSGVSNVIVRPFSANTITEKISKIFGQG